MNHIKLNDNRIVNISEVLLVKIVRIDKSEVLWDRINTTGGIEYILIDGSHLIEKYESYEAAEAAFDALEYDNFKLLENINVLVNKNYIKQLKVDSANELKLDYELFNGFVQDVFESTEDAKDAFNDVIEELTGESPEPTPVTLSSIAVTTAPTKTAYVEEEDFVSTGMVVTATYSDTTSKTVSNYEVTNGTSLTVGQTSVTISYTEGGITKTTSQIITVTAATLTSIEITTAPTKTTYLVGESFDPTGMVITGTYDNSKTKTITTYSYAPQGALTAEDTTITVTVGQLTDTQTITVSEINQEETVE